MRRAAAELQIPRPPITDGAARQMRAPLRLAAPAEQDIAQGGAAARGQRERDGRRDSRQWRRGERKRQRERRRRRGRGQLRLAELAERPRRQRMPWARRPALRMRPRQRPVALAGAEKALHGNGGMASATANSSGSATATAVGGDGGLGYRSAGPRRWGRCCRKR